MGNKQDSERRAAPGDEHMLNYTRRVQGYVLNDDFKVF
jgi:hypothetical protein